MEFKEEEKITISKEKYKELVKDQMFLRVLEAAGVDGWEGFDVAIDYINDKLDYEDKCMV